MLATHICPALCLRHSDGLRRVMGMGIGRCACVAFGWGVGCRTLCLTHFSLDMKYAISLRWFANPNQDHNNLICGARINILFIVRAKVLMLVKQSYSPPSPTMLTLEPLWVPTLIYSWWMTYYRSFNMLGVQYVWISHAFWCSFLDAQSTTHHSNLGVRYHQVVVISTSTYSYIVIHNYVSYDVR